MHKSSKSGENLNGKLAEQPLKSKQNIRFLDQLAIKNFLNKITVFWNKLCASCHLKAPNGDKSLAEDRDINSKFYRFSQKTVEDAMIPRSDISAVKHDVSLEELGDTVIKSFHTGTPVYEDNLDNIIGFVHIKDLFKAVTSKNRQNFQLKKIIRKPIISAPSTKLTDLLSEMQKQRTHIAIVIDEYGGTDGMVTIEDIIDEIVSMFDENDYYYKSNSYKIINSKTILASARVEVEALEKILSVKLKNSNDPEYDTIGGLVLAKVGKVPIPGTKIDISPQVEIEILEANSRVLKKVRLKLKDEKRLPERTTSEALP